MQVKEILLLYLDVIDNVFLNQSKFHQWQID